MQPFWMGHYGHWLPKRSCVWSNSPLVRALDRGRWRGIKKKSGKLGMAKNGVFYYIDKNGRKKCHGTAKLKKSQQRVCYKQAVVGGDIVTSCAFMLAAMRERERERERERDRERERAREQGRTS